MQIAFFGLGNMGSPIAANLIKSGYNVTITVHHNPAPAERLIKLGAHLAETPALAVADADVIFTIVPNDTALLNLLTPELLKVVKPGATIIEMTSASGDAVCQVAKRCRKYGLNLLDAPVSGGVSGATKGTMSILCAGDKAILEKVRPLLDCISGKVCYLGEQIGQAKIVKSLNNLLSAINKTAVTEAYKIAMKKKVSPQVFYDAISVSSGNSAAFGAVVPRLRAKDFSTGFSVALMRKDLELALALKPADLNLPLSETVLEYYKQAAPFDQEDSSAVAKVNFNKTK